MPASVIRRRSVLASVLAVAFVSSLAFAPRSDGAEPVAAPAAAPAPIAADPPVDPASPLNDAVRRLLNAPALSGGQVTVAVLDVASGRYLAAHGAHALMNPASNAKLYTAAVALATLRGDHRFVTSLNGTLKDGAVDGNLTLRGFGDPSLTKDDLAGLVAELKTRGVRRIEGDLVVDQRFFDGETTPPAFEQQPNEWAPFRAPVAAVSVDENTVTLSIRPGAAGNVATASFSPPGFVDIDGSVRTENGGGDHVILDLSPGDHRLNAKLSGSIGEDAHVVRYTRRVEDPTLLAGYVVKQLLADAGIAFKGAITTAGPRAPTRIPVLASHDSAPLSTLLYELGKSSDNFYAEMVLKSLGGEAQSAPARTADGAALVMRWLEHNGASDPGMVIKNGSGLFDANRVTAGSVVSLLRAAWRDPAIQPEFVAQLAIGGVDGTLRKRFASHRQAKDIRAKTGTLQDTAALSGYVLAADGGSPLAFSILVNHIPGKVGDARTAMDAFVEAVSASRRR
jgi:D-alanyl-D-alanine carboxypeptidase/D-alanyl-D-alanine-endopeptidase (penicillin-binding protein 4)